MKYLLIASRPRSGTHWLRTSLASCPGVASIGVEPFHPEYHNSELGYWDGESDPRDWIQSNTPDDCELGIICNHPTYIEADPRILPALQSLVTHVVCLYRRDVLAAYVSNELATKNNHWRTKIGEPPAQGTITVHWQGLARWHHWITESIRTTQARWGEWPMRTIAYEDLCGDWRGTMDRLGKWLDIDTTAAKPGTEKHELRPLWQVVENYQEARTWAAKLAIP